MKEIIATEKAPAAIGPYSQAVCASGLVFISGQLPVDPQTNEFAGPDIVSQTRMSLTNIKNILEEKGLNMGNIVKTTVFLKNMGDFAAMNEVYAGFFEGDYPARAAIEVAALPKGALVEIEAIASL